MIGEPMNFMHLTHIGSGDMAAHEGLPMVRAPALTLGAYWEGGARSTPRAGSCLGELRAAGQGQVSAPGKFRAAALSPFPMVGHRVNLRTRST